MSLRPKGTFFPFFDFPPRVFAHAVPSTWNVLPTALPIPVFPCPAQLGWNVACQAFLTPTPKLATHCQSLSNTLFVSLPTLSTLSIKYMFISWVLFLSLPSLDCELHEDTTLSAWPLPLNSKHLAQQDLGNHLFLVLFFINLFINLLFIFGCVGSSLLLAGFP